MSRDDVDQKLSEARARFEQKLYSPEAGDIRRTPNGVVKFDGHNWIHESHWRVDYISPEQPTQLTLDLDPSVLSEQQQQYTESKYDNTPMHYISEYGDLYDTFIQQYGFDAWKQHAEMEVIQYVMRASRKGHYLNDINKAIVILERIVYEHNQRDKGTQ